MVTGSIVSQLSRDSRGQSFIALLPPKLLRGDFIERGLRRKVGKEGWCILRNRNDAARFYTLRNSLNDASRFLAGAVRSAGIGKMVKREKDRDIERGRD